MSTDPQDFRLRWLSSSPKWLPLRGKVKRSRDVAARPLMPANYDGLGGGPGNGYWLITQKQNSCRCYGNRRGDGHDAPARRHWPDVHAQQPWAVQQRPKRRRLLLKRNAQTSRGITARGFGLRQTLLQHLRSLCQFLDDLLLAETALACLTNSAPRSSRLTPVRSLSSPVCGCRLDGDAPNDQTWTNPAAPPEQMIHLNPDKLI